MTLTEFLEREIAADEAVARRAQRAYQHVSGIPHYFTANSDTSVAMNPRVALAEVEAKRRIVALHTCDPLPLVSSSDPRMVNMVPNMPRREARRTWSTNIAQPSARSHRSTPTAPVSTPRGGSTSRNN
jgi:hypothetical protein